MEGLVKVYYLLQFSYWLQQMLVLILRLEKPRSDFNELVIHHCVTLWLVGWSYVFSLTSIGVAIFVSMDLPDVAFALSKCLNYLDLQHTSEASFVFFLGVWHYLRHYQNLRIIWSVWQEYDSIPRGYGSWSPETGELEGWWLVARTGARAGRLAGWMRWQILAPIVLLQCKSNLKGRASRHRLNASGVFLSVSCAAFLDCADLASVISDDQWLPC